MIADGELESHYTEITFEELNSLLFKFNGNSSGDVNEDSDDETTTSIYSHAMIASTSHRTLKHETRRASFFLS
jgi:hypothetical protein